MSAISSILFLALAVAPSDVEVRQLNAPPPPGEEVKFWWITPSGDKVLYVVGPDSPQRKLFVVSTLGAGTPMELASGFSAHALKLTPDGERAVFSTGTSPAEELRSVELDGSSPVLLATGSLGEFEFVDSTRVAFVDSSNPVGKGRLYVVPMDGSSAPLLLSTGMSATSSVVGLRLDPNGEFAVYRSSPELSLHRVPLDGSGPPVTISAAWTVLDNLRWSLSPDGEYVVFRSFHDVGFISYDDLWSVRTDGVSAPVLLHSVDAPETELAIDPSSTWVLFNERGSTTRYLSVPLDGSAAALELVPTEATNVRFTPDGARVLFRADYPTDNRFYVHATAIDGSTPRQILSGPLVAAGDVESFELSADGGTVVYRADQVVNDRFELFTVPSDGSALARQVSGPMPDWGFVGSPLISPDGRFVAFSAMLEELSRTEPYLAPLQVVGPRRKLMDVPAFRGAGPSGFGPRGFQLLILSDKNVDDHIDLYLARFEPDGKTAAGAPTRSVTRDL
jgi:hypothetical protein